MDDIEREIAKWPRWKLWLHSRWFFWAYSWLAILRYKMQRAYDSVMIACWPYERFPHEWRSLWKWEKK